MIILHSLALLEQLSELEQKIAQIEGAMERLGIEIDREKLVKMLTGQRAKALMTGEE